MEYLDFVQHKGVMDVPEWDSYSQEKENDICFITTKKTTPMKKYLVKLMFNINIDNGNNTSEFDEQIRVVEANSLENAFYKARSLGKKEEETFFDKESKMVSWNFIDVAEVYPLEEVKDGDQLYSNTRKIKDTNSFISYIRQKSMEIQAKKPNLCITRFNGAANLHVKNYPAALPGVVALLDHHPAVCAAPCRPELGSVRH